MTPRHESMDPRNWARMAVAVACQQAKRWGWTWKRETNNGFTFLAVSTPKHGELWCEAMGPDFVRLVQEYRGRQ